VSDCEKKKREINIMYIREYHVTRATTKRRLELLATKPGLEQKHERVTAAAALAASSKPSRNGSTFPVAPDTLYNLSTRSTVSLLLNEHACQKLEISVKGRTSLRL